MRLIIAGGRDYYLSEKDYLYLDLLHLSRGVTCVISGCADGADLCGINWANRNGIPVKKFSVTKEDWVKYGKAAGPMRNERMAKVADAVVLFPGGAGTDNMFKQANKYRLDIYDTRFTKR